MTEVEWHGFQLLSLGTDEGRGHSSRGAGATNLPGPAAALAGTREVRVARAWSRCGSDSDGGAQCVCVCVCCDGNSRTPSAIHHVPCLLART